MSDWLELELADRLAPVRAPERLWSRVQRAEPMAERIASPRRRPVKTALLLAAAAAASVWLAAAWRPDTGRAQSLVVRMNSADMACRNCHAD